VLILVVINLVMVRTHVTESYLVDSGDEKHRFVIRMGDDESDVAGPRCGCHGIPKGGKKERNDGRKEGRKEGYP
jgi:hypothetical protein